MISRRMMQTVVGLLWVFDAAFLHGGTALADVCVSIVQVLTGFAMTFNIKLKWTLAFSVFWSFLVWIAQEEYGQVFSGQVLPFYGAAGAALLFGITSVAIWPARKGGPSVWNKRGVRFAQISLGVLFAVGFILHFQVAYLMQQGLSQFAELPWFQAIASDQGSGLFTILAVTELIIALMLISGFFLTWATWLSVLLDGVFWTLQLHGEIFDPLAVSTASGIALLTAVVSAGPKQWRNRKVGTSNRHPVLR